MGHRPSPSSTHKATKALPCLKKTKETTNLYRKLAKKTTLYELAEFFCLVSYRWAHPLRYILNFPLRFLLSCLILVVPVPVFRQAY